MQRQERGLAMLTVEGYQDKRGDWPLLTIGVPRQERRVAIVDIGGVPRQERRLTIVNSGGGTKTREESGHC